MVLSVIFRLSLPKFVRLYCCCASTLLVDLWKSQSPAFGFSILRKMGYAGVSCATCKTFTKVVRNECGSCVFAISFGVVKMTPSSLLMFFFVPLRYFAILAICLLSDYVFLGSVPRELFLLFLSGRRALCGGVCSDSPFTWGGMMNE